MHRKNITRIRTSGGASGATTTMLMVAAMGGLMESLVQVDEDDEVHRQK